MRLKQRINPLQFPFGSRRGFDPSHIAARSCEFSGHSNGSTFINLLKGKSSTANSSTASHHGIIGPCTTMTTTTSTTFGTTTKSNTADQNATMAAIFVMTTSNTNTFCFNGTTTSTSGLGIIPVDGNGGLGMNVNNIVTISSGFGSGTTGTNQPYFVITSWSHVAGVGGAYIVNFLLLNLITGNMRSNQVTGTCNDPNAADGGISIGRSATVGFAGSVAAAMYSKEFMPLGAMRAWAEEPWSFWFPFESDDRNYVGVAAAAAAFFSRARTDAGFGKLWQGL